MKIIDTTLRIISGIWTVFVIIPLLILAGASNCLFVITRQFGYLNFTNNDLSMDLMKRYNISARLYLILKLLLIILTPIYIFFSDTYKSIIEIKF